MRHFKLSFIGIHSKLMQSKIDQLCKSLKVELVFLSEKLQSGFLSKDPYQSEHLSKVVCRFVVLAVMLVMLVRLANIWQPE